jgi:hypothetical protein
VVVVVVVVVESPNQNKNRGRGINPSPALQQQCATNKECGAVVGYFCTYSSSYYNNFYDTSRAASAHLHLGTSNKSTFCKKFVVNDKQEKSCWLCTQKSKKCCVLKDKKAHSQQQEDRKALYQLPGCHNFTT